MNRTLFIVFGVIAACASAIPVRAISIPMVYNNTTLDARADWDMEGSGNPAAGTVSYYAEGNGVAGVVTAASEGISASEGSQILKSYREPGTQSWATLSFTALSTHTLTTTFAIQCKDSASYETLLAGHTAGAENIMELYFLGTGAIQFYNSGWQTLTSTHNIGAWNTVVLKHTNSTANWTLSVNGSSPEAFTVTDAVNFPFGVAGSGGRLRSWKFQNANDAPSTVYIDAVPAAVLPGDFNGNGVVDAADYALWRKNPTAYLPADYNTWRSNFGNPPGSGSSLGEGSASNVPEPGSIVLVIVACLGLMVSRRMGLVRG